MKANELTADSFESAILNTEKPVLVDFHAPWCGPCRMLGPIIDEIASEQSDRAVVSKLNIDNAPSIAGRYGITSIPALIVFRDGKPVTSARGVQPKSAILDLIAKAAPPAGN